MINMVNKKRDCPLEAMLELHYKFDKMYHTVVPEYKSTFKTYMDNLDKKIIDYKNGHCLNCNKYDGFLDD